MNTCKSHDTGTRTAVRCKICQTIIISINRNDFVRCDCKDDPIAVDGGSDYLRMIGDPSKMELVSLKTGRNVRCKPDRVLR